MSLLDRIRTCHHWHPENYRPFLIDGVRYGFVRHELARKLADFADVFEVSGEAVALREQIADFETRSAAMESVVQDLVKEGLIARWRGEDYGVLNQWGDEPIMKLDRGAAGDFGIRGYGVHLNGLVRGEDGLKMWVGKRSLSKPNAPGKLDHLVAGGQPFGLSIKENLAKESAEEADIPESLARQAVPTGLVSYRCEREGGLRDDILFCYDLYLPEDFTPENTDGEVESFSLWPIEEIMARIAETDDFKFNVNLVIIHLLIREGYIRPDDPDYCALTAGLQRRGA